MLRQSKFPVQADFAGEPRQDGHDYVANIFPERPMIHVFKIQSDLFRENDFVIAALRIGRLGQQGFLISEFLGWRGL
jgi:hypothetical protein